MQVTSPKMQLPGILFCPLFITGLGWFPGNYDLSQGSELGVWGWVISLPVHGRL